MVGPLPPDMSDLGEAPRAVGARQGCAWGIRGRAKRSLVRTCLFERVGCTQNNIVLEMSAYEHHSYRESIRLSTGHVHGRVVRDVKGTRILNHSQSGRKIYTSVRL